MRKLVLSAVLGFLGLGVQAQNWTPAFTHTTGTAVYVTSPGPPVPISVTVSPILSPATTPPACGTGPYYIAANAATKGGYHFDFVPAATHVKFEVSELQGDDTVYIKINGAIMPITAAMLSGYSPTCAGATSIYSISKGRLTSTLIAGVNGATIVYGSAPGYINSAEIIHMHDSATSSGVVVSAYAAFDTCKQPFEATADSPYCKKRTLKLHATNFPGSTFSWTTTASPMPPTEVNKSDPEVPGLQLPQSNGYYIVTATRGICSYIDSVLVDVDNTPEPPGASYKGPKCAGETDSIIVNTASNTNIYAINPAGALLRPQSPIYVNVIDLVNMQSGDAGQYKIFAVTYKGCVTDTTYLDISLNSLVKADFGFDIKLGCLQDSVQFEDRSLGNTNWSWNFDDGSPLFQGNNAAVHANPLHLYSSQGTFKVKLLVSNAKCSDSLTKNIVLNHPLAADFTMDDDSVCQGDSVQFTNLSTATPATSPTFLWDFKDGETSIVFQPKHKFVKYGNYQVQLTITDYLGCTRTITKELVVDSIGSASFFTDTVLCTGETIKFEGDYSLIGGTYALWDFADGHTIQDEFSIQHAYDKPGIYDVKLEAHYRVCKDTTYHQNIYVNAYPLVDLGPDTAMCPQGEAIALKDLINSPATNPDYKWRWNTETKDTTANIMVHHPGTYSVTVDNQGCTSADSIVVKKNCYIDIPNVFTPNGDGFNDYFLPRQFLSRNVSKFSMSIYNRWGAKVFETTNLNGRGWDGKMNDQAQPEGVYVYMIKVSFGNNTNESYTGNITLLR